jgi:DNA-directed RNA polymerase subunit beta
MEITKKYFSRYKAPLSPMPSLVDAQKKSYEWLVSEGLKEVFKEFSPIRDYSGKKFELEFTGFDLAAPKYDEHHARLKEMTYEAPLRVTVKLKNKTLGVEKEQEIFLADFPCVTDRGTFIINGVERVVVPQLARSFGIFFTAQELKSGKTFGAKVIPSRGAWIEIETDADGALSMKIDRKRKFPATLLFRVLGGWTTQQIKDAFAGNPAAMDAITKTIAKEGIENEEEAYLEIYRRLRDGDVASAQNAKELINGIFSRERYDLSAVGRFRFNKRFKLPMDDKALAIRTLTVDDLVVTFQKVVSLNHTKGAQEDDIDHLGSRRVRYVGEMLQQKLRVGMTQMKRNIQDRMSTVESDTILPINLVSPRPLQARLKEFFTTNQLSQLMVQENILAEVEHLRTVSAMGPGGLTKERAGFEVRDVHTSHYGRLCPIHTPEGPNIGLILRLATHARVNDFGVIETPYVKVKDGKITGEIAFMNALEEERHIIAHASVPYDKDGNISASRVECRIRTAPGLVAPQDVEFIDVAANQAFSVATSLIPFLEHDDANRALMGSNMQKQATPCIIPQAPLVATGMERKCAIDSGRVVLSPVDGEVTAVDAKHIEVTDAKGKVYDHKLITFSRTNGFTTHHQRPTVTLGQKLKKGDVLADNSTSDRGELALGQNVRVAFMSWGGNNYEDAIILSERLVRNNIFTSIHIEQFVCNVRDTKLGPEVTTPDIPNVGESKLKDLDHEGIVRVGAEVRPGDILVGKITPKGEAQLTPEERLLRSIFGEKARDVKDTSLRMEHGKRGRIIGVKVFSRENGDPLDSGIIKRIHVEIAQLRNISVGDKLAGRHGNKGVIARILPIEEMPFDENGEPIDVILTPLGVPSRMNLGQILELHLGHAALKLGYQAITPAFQSVGEDEIREELKKAGLQENGKMKLYDGRTGEAFEQEISVGVMYVLKLHHMVEDKIHMRSIGPYSLITQQPLGGKAQGGGQRFGEMEVWALEGYGASHMLREILTVKSDDIVGRSSTFDSIVKGRPLREPNLPATFYVLLNNLRGLALDIELHRTEGIDQ